jgi:hypothetical protein
LHHILLKTDPPKEHKIESVQEKDKMAFKRLARENVFFFRKMYTLYIQKEQIAGQNNDYSERISGFIVLDMALCLILCKEDPLNYYKIECAKE